MADLRSRWIVIVGVFFLVLAGNRTARGQSTILNVPSTETMSRNQLYVEADLIAHGTAHKDGGFLWYGPSVIYGIGRNIEVGVNAYLIKDAGPTTGIEIQPNA